MAKQYPHYPVYLDIEGRTVVIVGGGGVAERKLATLLRYGPRVEVVSPEFSPGFERWGSDARVELRRKAYESGDLDRACLVIAATDQRGVNEAVAADARRRHVPVNVIDDPEGGDFIVPAVVDRGSIQIAVSTGGKSPALARRIRERLEEAIGPEYSAMNGLLGQLRTAAQDALPTDADRKRFFDALLEAGILEMLRQGRREQAAHAVEGICREWGVPFPSAPGKEFAAGEP